MVKNKFCNNIANFFIFNTSRANAWAVRLVILLFVQQMKSPHSLLRFRNFHVNQRTKIKITTTAITKKLA